MPGPRLSDFMSRLFPSDARRPESAFEPAADLPEGDIADLHRAFRAWLANDASGRAAEMQLARLILPYASLSDIGRRRYHTLLASLDDADQAPVLPDVSQFEEIADWRGPRGSRKAVALSLLPPVDRILAVLAELKDGQDVLRRFVDDLDGPAADDDKLAMLRQKIRDRLADG